MRLQMATPNIHISTALDCIRQMQSFVCTLPLEQDRQQFLALINELSKQVVCASNDLAICEYRISEASKQLYEPVIAAQAGECCRYIDTEAVANSTYSLSEFEKKLQQACESEAHVLGQFIHKYTKIGYLDFHGESKKKIFCTLREYFPTMRQYGYRNFAAVI